MFQSILKLNKIFIWCCNGIHFAFLLSVTCYRRAPYVWYMLLIACKWHKADFNKLKDSLFINQLNIEISFTFLLSHVMCLHTNNVNISMGGG